MGHRHRSARLLDGRTRLLRFIGVASLVGCVTSPEAAPLDPPALVPVEALEIDPCADVDLDQVIARARADEHEPDAATLDHALACATDATQAYALADLQLGRVEQSRQSAAADPVLDACKTNSEGVCIYRPSKSGSRWDPPERPQPIPYDEAELQQLAAYVVYEAHAPASELLRSRRLDHIRLRVEHGDLAGSQPLLERYLLDYDAHPSSVWAANTLLDLLLIRLGMLDDLEAARPLWDWTERLSSMASMKGASTLLERIPMLRAGAMWREAIRQRSLGVAAVQARDEALPSADEWPADPEPYFVACAEILLIAFDTFENHDRASTLLWNAAECFDAGYESEAALGLLERLIERFPASEHAQDATYDLAMGELALGRFGPAATHLFEFGKRYPKDSRASQALRSALELEDALGRDARRIAEIEGLYIALYEHKDVVKAARFVWSRRPDAPRELLAFAESHHDRFGTGHAASFLDAERVVLELRYAEACRQRLSDGLCIERREPRTSPTCTLGGTSLPRVRPRDSRRMQVVADLLTRAPKLASRDWALSSDEHEEASLLRFRASTGLLALELELEAWLLAGPDALDASERAEALDRGYAELAELAKLAESAESGPVDLAIRAHARRALVWEQLANAGLTRVDGVCTPITRADEAHVARASAAYHACLDLAVERQWFDEVARGCERALAFIEPAITPPLAELIGQPRGFADAEIRSIGVVADPWLRAPLEPI